MSKAVSTAIIAVVVIVGFVIGGVWLTSGNETAADAADGFMNDFVAGECANMYNNATESFTSQVAEQEWLDSCGRIYPSLEGERELITVETEPTSSGATRAVATYEVQSADDLVIEVSIIMIRETEDSPWLMNDFGFQTQGIDIPEDNVEASEDTQ